MEVIPDAKNLLGASKIPDAINVGNVINHRSKFRKSIRPHLYILINE